MLDGRQARRSRIEGSGGVGLLADRALHLQLDQAVHLHRVPHRQLLDDQLDEAVDDQLRGGVPRGFRTTCGRRVLLADGLLA